MTYDELCENVLDAIRQMEELHATPSEIKLSPEAFNTLVEGSQNRPMLFGLRIHVENIGKAVFRVQ